MISVLCKKKQNKDKINKESNNKIVDRIGIQGLTQACARRLIPSSKSRLVRARFTITVRLKA
jgi:hypothetical protein